MRREKTHKVCANHFITPDIRMNAHCGSNKAFNWSVFADFADETYADLWKCKFAEAQEIVRTKCSLYTDDMPSSDDESSITRSEDTDTPEPRHTDKSPASDKRDEDGVVLQLKKLNVESEE
ncbi:RAN binding protein [Operophtera brumata]|uniref:RAN binding protein n=1 Tax=Operophtera brumata TaxID=104452 RepID=A0A0L7KLU9_OPEBR|nr:RAN binding protein [Operophtera brumata]